MDRRATMREVAESLIEQEPGAPLPT
jgi:AmiR/NasT family two-component response regulator